MLKPIANDVTIMIGDVGSENDIENVCFDSTLVTVDFDGEKEDVFVKSLCVIFSIVNSNSKGVSGLIKVAKTWFGWIIWISDGNTSCEALIVYSEVFSGLSRTFKERVPFCIEEYEKIFSKTTDFKLKRISRTDSFTPGRVENSWWELAVSDKNEPSMFSIEEDT